MKILFKMIIACACLYPGISPLHAQPASTPLYSPDADAAAEIQAAVQQARETGRHVFLQIGGNWCSWCIKFHRFIAGDARLDSLQQADFVVRRINFSRENMNEAVMAELEFPQRFGFPVFVILDGEGHRIHTQNSGLLEAEAGYDRRKVEEFLLQWRPAALRPETYQK